MPRQAQCRQRFRRNLRINKTIGPPHDVAVAKPTQHRDVRHADHSREFPDRNAFYHRRYAHFTPVAKGILRTAARIEFPPHKDPKKPAGRGSPPRRPVPDSPLLRSGEGTAAQPARAKHLRRNVRVHAKVRELRTADAIEHLLR